MARGSVKLIRAKMVAESPHMYSGPMKFRGRCSNCDEARNRHCGHCKACPGWHVESCMRGFQTGTWH